MAFDLRLLRDPSLFPHGLPAPMWDGSQVPEPPRALRLDPFDMRLTLELMDAAGLVSWRNPPPVVCPPGFDMTPSISDRAEGPEVVRRRALAALAAVYLDENDAVLRQETLSGDGQVASYKWQTNLGWVVTPAECEAVARCLRRRLEELVPNAAASEYFESEEEGRRWLEGWIAFHELAVEHDGYRVT